MASLVIVVSAVLVLSRGQTDRQTDGQTEADKRFTAATLVGVSSNIQRQIGNTVMTANSKDCQKKRRIEG